MKLSRENKYRRATPSCKNRVANGYFASYFFLGYWQIVALLAVGGSIGLSGWITQTKNRMIRFPQSSSSPPEEHLTNEGGEVSPLHRNRTVNDGIEYLWQLPEKKKSGNDDSSVACEAILFLAHGCSHSMTDWWPPQPSCPDCIGLPEERAIVDIAIRKFNYLVVAVSSVDRRSKCWGIDDGSRVATVLTELQDIVAAVPIYALGASSGGVFVSSILPTFLQDKTDNRKFRGYVAQIAVPQKVFASIPAIFITMERDRRTDHGVSNLQEEYMMSMHLSVAPLAIDPIYFANMIGREFYSFEFSRRMVEAMRLAGLLNEENGTLWEDPRRSDWRKVLHPFAHYNDDLLADLSPLSEVLNVAWGMHEITRQQVEYALLELNRFNSEAIIVN